MRRREFLTLAGAAAASFPPAAHAQTAKQPTIGILGLGNPPIEPFVKGLREALQAVGYSEDRNIRLEVRSAGGVAPTSHDVTLALPGSLGWCVIVSGFGDSP